MVSPFDWRTVTTNSNVTTQTTSYRGVEIRTTQDGRFIAAGKVVATERDAVATINQAKGRW